MNWLPDHKCSLYLTHNEHLSVYETVEEYYNERDFVSMDEWQKAVAENNVWMLQWYAETPVGFYRLAASSLDAIKDALKDETT